MPAKGNQVEDAQLSARTLKLWPDIVIHNVSGGMLNDTCPAVLATD